MAAACMAVGLSAPAVGHGVQHALFAHNSDKVDGRHAVGARASVDARKGKLVATSLTTGLLPDNIIGTVLIRRLLSVTQSDEIRAEHLRDEVVTDVPRQRPQQRSRHGGLLLDPPRLRRVAESAARSR